MAHSPMLALGPRERAELAATPTLSGREWPAPRDCLGGRLTLDNQAIRKPAAARARRRLGRPPAGRGVTETIAKVARSASRDETRPILKGILVSAQGTELRMVATDSYRLSDKTTTLDEPIPGDGFEANVPARTRAWRQCDGSSANRIFELP